MSRVVVPVRYPLTHHSKATLAEAIRIAGEKDAALTVLHVDLYHHGGEVTRADLKRAVEQEFGRIPRARYVVREGFLVEETILDEVAAEGADVVVVGHKQLGRFRRTLRRLTNNPDIESYLRERLDARIVTAEV